MLVLKRVFSTLSGFTLKATFLLKLIHMHAALQKAQAAIYKIQII